MGNDLQIKLEEVFGTLLSSYGRQAWWPGEGPFEVMVGAVLTQATSWHNAAKAVENLRSAGALSPEAVHRLPPEELAALIRPSGYYRQKAARLKVLAAFIRDEGGLPQVLGLPTAALRKKLLSISGIGPETADSIVLYAAERAVFVVDRYTVRILRRMGLIARRGGSYDAVARLFIDRLPVDLDLYKEFHALLVVHAKAHCRTQPRCSGCPLRPLCAAVGVGPRPPGRV